MLLDRLPDYILLGLYINISRKVESIFSIICIGIATLLGIFILNNISYYLANLKKKSDN